MFCVYVVDGRILDGSFLEVKLQTYGLQSGLPAKTAKTAKTTTAVVVNILLGRSCQFGQQHYDKHTSMHIVIASSEGIVNLGISTTINIVTTVLHVSLLVTHIIRFVE